MLSKMYVDIEASSNRQMQEFQAQINAQQVAQLSGSGQLNTYQSTGISSLS
jgi:hypothetical protein